MTSNQFSSFGDIACGFCIQNSGRLVVIVVWASLMVYCTRFIPSEPVGQLLFAGFYLVFAYALWSYSAQTVSEFWLLIYFTRLIHGIDARTKAKKPTRTQLLSIHNSVRTNMIQFLSRSGSQISPVSDILLEKLKQSVDLFFYASSLVVFSEKPDFYSVSEKREAELEEESRDYDSDMEKAEQAAAESDEDALTGYVRYFSLNEVKTFVTYLGNRIFRKSGFHAFWISKYTINLIDYLNFFEHWNYLLSESKNGSSDTACKD